ncbi:Os09g0310150 [Oryza sativa Japonica Group]|uniref:Os09g0310150 protein n=1 Tax=Oryza sativa subsp. japonica TaxID=39947 RepID=A0A0P0XKT3_ORYSJ|nr:Os09g0310150 [Oryza sativa Japonica Group]
MLATTTAAAAGATGPVAMALLVWLEEVVGVGGRPAMLTGADSARAAPSTSPAPSTRPAPSGGAGSWHLRAPPPPRVTPIRPLLPPPHAASTARTWRTKRAHLCRASPCSRDHRVTPALRPVQLLHAASARSDSPVPPPPPSVTRRRRQGSRCWCRCSAGAPPARPTHTCLCSSGTGEDGRRGGSLGLDFDNNGDGHRRPTPLGLRWV